METKQLPTYLCEYCHKLYKRPKFCQDHETYCSANPNNLHKCYQGCRYLVSIDDFRKSDWGQQYIYGITYGCEYCDKLLYSYIDERRGVIDLSERARMPLECKYYEPLD